MNEKKNNQLFFIVKLYEHFRLGLIEKIDKH